MLVVFGSINADLIFPVPTLPQVGETVLTSAYRFEPGGKGANQAVAAARAGAEVRFVGRLGEDPFAAELRRSLVAAGVDDGGLGVTPGMPSGTAVVAVDARGDNQILVAGGANLAARAEDIPEDWLGPATTLLCQNELTPAETHAALARAKARGARTVWNLAPAMPVPAEVWRHVDVLMVNRREAEVLLGGPLADAVAAARALHERFGVHAILTLGGEGAVSVHAGGHHRVPALAVEVVDSTGAGDAFCGVFAAGLDLGLALEDALAEAAIAGALATTAVGARSAYPTAATIAALRPRLGPIRRQPTG